LITLKGLSPPKTPYNYTYNYTWQLQLSLILLTIFTLFLLKGGNSFIREALPLFDTLIQQKLSSLERPLPLLDAPSCGYLVKGFKGTFVPLKNSLPLPLTKGKGIQGIGLLPYQITGKKTLERGLAPLFSTLPLPLIRKGGQGDRLLHDLLNRY